MSASVFASNFFFGVLGGTLCTPIVKKWSFLWEPDMVSGKRCEESLGRLSLAGGLIQRLSGNKSQKLFES